jgi:hypothetical protein
VNVRMVGGDNVEMGGHARLELFVGFFVRYGEGCFARVVMGRSAVT